MKKIMFVAAMSALVLSACSKSEVVERSNQGAIDFESFVGKATKATPVSDFADGSKMLVWGYSSDAALTDNLTGAVAINNLNGEVFTRTTGKWDSGKVAYWLVGKQHHFLALAPSEAQGSTIAATGIATIKVEDNLDNQKDILVAQPLMDIAYSDSPVAQTFTFRHVLSQVKFTASFTEEQAAAAKNVKITKIVFKPSTGTFNNEGTINVPAYTAGNFDYTGTTGNVASYTVIPATAVAANYTTEVAVPHATNDVAMVLPQGPTAKLVIEVTVTYDDAADAPQTKVVNITSKDDFAWEANKIYNYKFSINIARNVLDYKPIEIGDPSISPWDTTENTPAAEN